MPQKHMIIHEFYCSVAIPSIRVTFYGLYLLPTFSFIENEHETELCFNKELWDKESLKIFNEKEGQKNIIEQIDSTFFVSMYNNGKRSASIPIKEVTAEFLILYAIPSGPMEIIARRKK